MARMRNTTLGHGISKEKGESVVYASTSIRRPGDSTDVEAVVGEDDPVPGTATAANAVRNELEMLSDSLEDVGDIARAAVAFSKRQPPPQAIPPPKPPSKPPLSPPGSPPTLGKNDILAVSPPSVFEEKLRYYEAKIRYLAAQEEACGGSATIIQARNRRGWQKGGVDGGGRGGRTKGVWAARDKIAQVFNVF